MFQGVNVSETVILTRSDGTMEVFEVEVWVKVEIISEGQRLVLQEKKSCLHWKQVPHLQIDTS